MHNRVWLRRPRSLRSEVGANRGKGLDVRRILEACLLLSLSLFCMSSHAAPVSPVTLGFEAPWECPNRDFFWHELWSRSVALAQAKVCPQCGGSPEARFAGSRHVPEVAVEIRIRQFGAGYAGLVQLRDAAGAVIERRVSGQLCADVTTALALATAVALDTSLEPEPLEGSVPQRPVKPSDAYSLGAAFGIHTAAQPMVLPTVGLAASWRAPSAPVAPELRIEALVSVSGRAHDATGLAEARFVWMASRSSVCAFGAALASMQFGPCALVELGALRGTGLTGPSAQSKTGLWLAPGALLFWALRHGNARLSVQSGLVFPLVRDRFVFTPNSEIFHPPSLGLIAELGLAWTFDG